MRHTGIVNIVSQQHYSSVLTSARVSDVPVVPHFTIVFSAFADVALRRSRADTAAVANILQMTLRTNSELLANSNVGLRGLQSRDAGNTY